MKVYIKFGGHDSYPAHEVKVKLPSSYISTGKVEQVLSLFTDSYNKKFPDSQLSSEKVTLLSHQDQILPVLGAIKDCIKEYDELKVVIASTKPVLVAPSSIAPGTVMCRNYGCGQRYLPDDNSSTSCSHHTRPPIFRETLKSWSCCPDRTAWDWDGFKALPTCATGPHCAEAPKQTFAESPTVALASSATAAPELVRSIDEYNKCNPDAVTAASSAAATVQSVRSVSVRRADGRMRCVHEGCKKWFLDGSDSDENGVASCVYHQLGPTFHEGFKFWGCCPRQKCTDFDEFLAVPGCKTGRHEIASVSAPAPSAASAVSP